MREGKTQTLEPSIHCDESCASALQVFLRAFIHRQADRHFIGIDGFMHSAQLLVAHQLRMCFTCRQSGKFRLGPTNFSDRRAEIIFQANFKINPIICFYSLTSSAGLPICDGSVLAGILIMTVVPAEWMRCLKVWGVTFPRPSALPA